MKTLITYLLLSLFAFAFSYQTAKYLAKMTVADISYSNMDCENEKESTTEKDEVIDTFYSLHAGHRQLLFREGKYLPSELVVNFATANYSNAIYSPPEFLS